MFKFNSDPTNLIVHGLGRRFLLKRLTNYLRIKELTSDLFKLSEKAFIVEIYKLENTYHDIINVIYMKNEVGHSYGGMVITGVAEIEE